MDIEQIKIESRRLKDSGATAERVIAFLRDKECSKALSIFILAGTYGYDMAKAKKEVHFSKTWADTRESDERWHEHLDQGQKTD